MQSGMGEKSRELQVFKLQLQNGSYNSQPTAPYFFCFYTDSVYRCGYTHVCLFFYAQVDALIEARATANIDASVTANIDVIDAPITTHIDAVIDVPIDAPITCR